MPNSKPVVSAVKEDREGHRQADSFSVTFNEVGQVYDSGKLKDRTYRKVYMENGEGELLLSRWLDQPTSWQELPARYKHDFGGAARILLKATKLPPSGHAAIWIKIEWTT